MPDGLYSMLTTCLHCDLWLHILRLDTARQALELPRIGWADNTSMLPDHSLAALNYRVSCTCHVCSILLDCGLITTLTQRITIS